MDNIKINDKQIANVVFDKTVICTVKKQITTVPTIESVNGEDVIKQNKLEYGIQFMVSGSTLKHALNMATLNSKTDIGNNFRARCKKDIDNGHNDTFDYFTSLLDDKGVLVVSGFPTGLPNVPETPEQRRRTIVKQYDTMDVNERKSLIAELQAM